MPGDPSYPFVLLTAFPPLNLLPTPQVSWPIRLKQQPLSAVLGQARRLGWLRNTGRPMRISCRPSAQHWQGRHSSASRWDKAPHHHSRMVMADNQTGIVECKHQGVQRAWYETASSYLQQTTTERDGINELHSRMAPRTLRPKRNRPYCRQTPQCITPMCCAKGQQPRSPAYSGTYSKRLVSCTSLCCH